MAAIESEPPPVAIESAALDRLFLSARTTYKWRGDAVDDATLEQLFDVLKFGPTSVNSQPGRFVFVRSAAEKERLAACVSPGNVEKVRAAPVTAIVAADLAFDEHLTELFPHNPGVGAMMRVKPGMVEETARRNATLQGGYLILAARALGLDCAPMSGFDRSAVDRAFLDGTTWRADFLCNIGWGDPAGQLPRLPRLPFARACRII